MKHLAGYTDVFLSPITGRLFRYNFPRLPLGCIWLGDEREQPQNFPFLNFLAQTNFILGKSNEDWERLFPNAQILGKMPDGIVKNVGGVIEIIEGDILTTHLEKDHLWLGNDENIATPQKNINVCNLPDLGVAIIEGLDLPAGKIWRGTASNRPEESDALSEALADILALNARFLLGEFIMGDALIQKNLSQSAVSHQS